MKHLNEAQLEAEPLLRLILEAKLERRYELWEHGEQPSPSALDFTYDLEGVLVTEFTREERSALADVMFDAQVSGSNLSQVVQVVFQYLKEMS